MKLFYGADREVIVPKYNYGNPSNDYGLGFYLTSYKEIAELWATQYSPNGYLIEYDVDLSNLKVLRLNTINDEDILVWLTILISHRFSKDERDRYKKEIEWLEKNYLIDLSKYDVIIGYRADDSYFLYSRDFVGNELSLEILKDAMKLGKLDIQIMLRSKKAFQKIKYLNSFIIPHSDEYELFRNKTKIEYLKLKKEDDVNNTYLRDIMRRRSDKHD